MIIRLASIEDQLPGGPSKARDIECFYRNF
jgi:hypothetical protein